MKKPTPKKPRRRKVSDADDISNDLARVVELIQAEGDLAAILVGASYLDACIGSLLKHHFRDGSVADRLLDVSGGALGSFQARADLCYALTLIDKRRYQDLSTIGTIRNCIAHDHLTEGFESPEIAALCDELFIPDLQRLGTAVEELRLLWENRSARSRFVWATSTLCVHILMAALRLKQSVPGA